MKKDIDKEFSNLPVCAIGYIQLVIKKMRYRKKVRADVQSELIAHFEDALRDCKNEEEKERVAKELIAEFGDAKILGKLARRAKKRCRPIWIKAVIKTFQAVCIMICLLVLYIGWFFSGKPKITIDYIAEANKLARPTADDSQNAAQFYNKAAKLIEVQEKQSYECINKSFSEANETDITEIKQWLDKNAEALSLIAQGSELPYYWQTVLPASPNDNSMINILMPYLSDYRKLVLGLKWRAYLSAEDKQYEKVFTDLLTVYKFGKHLKGKATIVENLVGMGMEVLSTDTFRMILYKYNDIPEDNLASFSNSLQSVVSNEIFPIASSFEFEKLFIYDGIQRCFTEDVFGFNHLCVKRIGFIGVLLGKDFYMADSSNRQTLLRGARKRLPKTIFHILFTHPDKPQTRETTNKIYDFWKRIAVQNPYSLKNRDIQKEFKELIKGNILLEILSLDMQAIIELSWRNKVDVEATIAIVAIQKFKQGKGYLPDNLQELVLSGDLASVPIDPFSGREIVYKITDNGFTLYSFGPDFDDDGGVQGKDRTGKILKWADNGDTVFWPGEK